MVQLHDCILDKGGNLLHVGTVSNTEGDERKHIAVVLGQILVVLREELGVRESDDGTVDGFKHGACVADACHFSFDSVAFNPVADLNSACHEVDAVVEVFENILRCETDTGGETAHDVAHPFTSYVKDVEANDEPDSPNQHLNDILSHHFARSGILKVLAFEVKMQEVEADAVQVAEEEVELNDLNDAEDADAEVRDIDEFLREDYPCQVA